MVWSMDFQNWRCHPADRRDEFPSPLNRIAGLMQRIDARD
jgi:hypothetical protein